MKRAIFSATVASCLLVACSQEQPPTPVVALAPAARPAPAQAAVHAATPVVGSERAVLDQFLAQLNAHDAGEAGGLLDEHVHYFDAFSGQIQHGRAEAVENVISMYMKAVPDGHWEIRSEPAASNGAIAY